MKPILHVTSEVKPRGWFWAEDAIFDLNVSIFAKMTLLYLKRRADSDGESYPSMPTIATAIGASKRKVYDAIKELQALGILEVTIPAGTGTVHHYHVRSVDPANRAIPLQEVPPTVAGGATVLRQEVPPKEYSFEGIPKEGIPTAPRAESASPLSELRGKNGQLSDEAWRASLDGDPAFKGVDIEREIGKATRWAGRKGRKVTRRFLENWLGRAEVQQSDSAWDCPGSRPPAEQEWQGIDLGR